MPNHGKPKPDNRKPKECCPSATETCPRDSVVSLFFFGARFCVSMVDEPGCYGYVYILMIFRLVRWETECEWETEWEWET